MGRVVLVTGISRYLGGRLARRLSEERDVDSIVGVDVIPPTHDIGRAQFVRADIRNPMIGKIIERTEVDTVVHMNVIATPTFAGGRTPMKEINVIGTMQLLAACQRSSRVRRLVVKSSAAVYGSSPRDPAMFTEGQSPKRLPSRGFGKDSVEVEGYIRGFARRRPDIDILVLRLASVVGPRIRSTMTDYFGMPVVPVPLGFDARLQLAHEDDAIEALALGALGEATGSVNVAGDGVVTVLQGAALAGRPVLPVPLFAAGPAGALAKRLAGVDFSADQVQMLAYGRGLDTTAMRAVLGFEPRFTTRSAFEDFAGTVPPLPGSHLLGGLFDGVAGAVGSAGSAMRSSLRLVHGSA